MLLKTYIEKKEQEKEKVCECEYCEEELCLGDEAFKTQEGMYCSKDCFIEEMMELNGGKYIDL